MYSLNLRMFGSFHFGRYCEGWNKHRSIGVSWKQYTYFICMIYLLRSWDAGYGICVLKCVCTCMSVYVVMHTNVGMNTKVYMYVGYCRV